MNEFPKRGTAPGPCALCQVSHPIAVFSYPVPAAFYIPNRAHFYFQEKSTKIFFDPVFIL